MTPLPSPAALKRQLPLSLSQRAFVEQARRQAMDILHKRDPRLACIVGPCSIHDLSAALEYAERLRRLATEIDRTLFLILRVFCEKPRTKAGWKGLLYDPDLDGTYNVKKGLEQTRQLLLALAERQIPCATEFLDPLAAPYYDDLIAWGFIGARTGASQIHRQLASALPFPVGFKNSIFGELDAALNGVQSARTPQTYLGIDETGHIAALQSRGNPHTHLVLRGSEAAPNFDLASLQHALSTLQAERLEPRLVVDCSHGNSGKDHRRQRHVFESVLEHADPIAGLMLESHLYAGKQPHLEDPAALHYGLSITDACIGWDETEELLLSAARALI